VIGLLSALLLVASTALAATYPELAERAARRPVAAYDNAYAGGGAPYGNGGVATAYPGYGNTAMYMLPIAGNGLPDARQVRWSYGQVNAASDPFFIWGLRTQGMYVPWSTPMSGWTNAQSWNWWRSRAGDSGPPPPLW
jgi:hypothetical protein